MDKIDLTGLGDWNLEDQEEGWDLLLEYVSIFAVHDMDLSKMSIMKHSIKHMDNTPFRECYGYISPSMYNEV